MARLLANRHKITIRNNKEQTKEINVTVISEIDPAGTRRMLRLFTAPWQKN